MTKWYRLDTVAVLFPAVAGKKNSAVFRVSCVLQEQVDKDILQKALNKAVDVYPMLFVRMRKGVFWNYFEGNTKTVFACEEREYPCVEINPSENNGYFIKTLYYKNRVSVEVFHSLTDGKGAVEFLKTLLHYYVAEKYKCDISQSNILLSHKNNEDDSTDSFTEHFSDFKKGALIKMGKDPMAYRIKGNYFHSLGNNVITSVLNASELNVVAKQNNTTIGGFLVAVLIYSIYHANQKYRFNKKPIVVAVPVSLRDRYKTTSLRNFFGVVNVSYSMTSHTQFEDVVSSVTSQLKMLTERENLEHVSKTYLKTRRNMFFNMVPLHIKNMFIPLGFWYIAENKKTMTLTNLGNIVLPPEIEQHVKHFETLLYPTAKSPINCAIITVNDKLAISFTRAVQETEILRYFFKFIADTTNLDVQVYSNDWGE